MPDMSPTIYVLLGWVLLLAIIVGFVVLAGLRRPKPRNGFSGDPRVGAVDRRSTSGDRRMGLPDQRVLRVERRRRSADRRGGSGDRRPSGPATA